MVRFMRTHMAPYEAPHPLGREQGGRNPRDPHGAADLTGQGSAPSGGASQLRTPAATPAPPPTIPVPPNLQDRLAERPLVLSERWASLVARHPPQPSRDRRRGPPLFPVELVVPAAREVGAAIINSSQSFLGRQAAEQADFTFTYTGPVASQHIRTILERYDAGRLHPEQANQLPPPVLLLVDVSARQLDSIIGTVSVAETPCVILVLGADGSTSPGGTDPVSLTASAHSTWGQRAVGRARHLVSVGRPFQHSRGHSGRTQLMALQIDFTDRPSRTISAPAVLVHWGEGMRTREMPCMSLPLSRQTPT